VPTILNIERKGPKVFTATAQAVGAGQRHCRGELEQFVRDTTLLLDVTRPLRAEPPQEVLQGGKPCSFLLAKQRKKGFAGRWSHQRCDALCLPDLKDWVSRAF
jgi:hypothetical protein